MLNEYQKQLVLDNQKLITYVIKKMNLINDYDDFYDIGISGLIKGAKRFNKKLGFKESGYLIRSIKNEILMEIRKNKANIRKANINTISLDKNISNDECGKSINLVDILPSKANIENELIQKEEIESLKKEISKLKEKEQLVIKYTFGLDGYKELKQNDISNILGVSQAQICRIKIQAIEKLKNKMSANG